ncbi:MAG: M48 family metallopeptidase [Bdellovibrionales bacterium]
MKGTSQVLQLEDKTIEILRRPRQKNMNLSVRGVGKIRVSCNKRRSVREILAFVESSGDFIARREREWKEMAKIFPPRRYLSGEKLLWEGERKILSVIWSWKSKISVVHQGDEIELLAPLKSAGEDRKQALIKYYRAFAKRDLHERVRKWALAMNLNPSRVMIRGQKTIWGSCSIDGLISLNWKLICVPPETRDYVVIHELSHMIHRNHSSRFWKMVERFSPNYLAHKAWLKSHEPEITRML